LIDTMRDLSVESGISVKEVGKATQALITLGINGRDSLAVVKASMDGLAATGNLAEGSFSDLNRALRQIGSKPFLQLEELNQISEHLPVSRTMVMKQIAKDTGDAISEVQKRFKDGTQQSGDALTAVVESLKALDKSGKALENRTRTLSGAFAVMKAKAALALGDIFTPAANKLADAFQKIDTKAIADKLGKPLADAIDQLVPTVVQALPGIVDAIAMSFKILIPLISGTVELAGKMANAFVEHKDQIESAVSSIGDLFGGIKAILVQLAPAFKPMLAQLALVIKLFGYLGKVLEFIAPVFKYVGKVSGFMFAPLITSIDLVLHAIEQLLDGIGLVPHNIPVFGAISAGADDAARRIHALRNELTSLGNQAAGQSMANRPGFDDRIHPVGEKKTSTEAPVDFKLPKFQNFGDVSSAADDAAKAAKKKAEAAAKRLITLMKGLAKSLDKYARDTGKQTLAAIQSNGQRIIDSMKESISTAAEAGDKVMKAALEKQLARFQKGNRHLIKLAKQRDAVLVKLTAAKDNLKKLQEESAGFMKSVQDSIMAFGNITRDSGGIRQTFIGMRRMLRNAVSDTRQFVAAIQDLQKMGLNETALRQIVEAGPEAGLQQAKALARAGQAGVNEINTLQGYLETAGKDLATGLNTQFYSAGIKAAEGLVAGLQSQQAALVKAMDSLADRLVSSIKTKLKIKSPSGVFEDEIGAMLPEGAARGIYKRMRSAERAASAMGQSVTQHFHMGGVEVNGVSDPKAAHRAGLLAGSGIADTLQKRRNVAAIAGVGGV